MIGLDADGVRAFLADQFPQALDTGAVIDRVSPDEAVLRMVFAERHLRPGGTIAGPTIMALADMAAYVLILGRLGPLAQAVTSHLDIDFLQRPEPRDLVARATPLRVGRTRFVTRVECFSAGDPQLVAHASVTYALPPRPA